jgi:crooked neck
MGAKKVQVKNRAPNSIQITAEQILRESRDRQAAPPKAPRQRITDIHELEEFRMRKRKEYEDEIRRQRMVKAGITLARGDGVKYNLLVLDNLSRLYFYLLEYFYYF